MSHGNAYLEHTAIGIALKAALAEMLDSQKDAFSGQESPPELTQDQVEPVLMEFMKVTDGSACFSNRPFVRQWRTEFQNARPTADSRQRCCFGLCLTCCLQGQRSDSLLLYRFCDGCWTFYLKGCNFESMQFRESVDVVKIIAREGEKPRR